MKVGGLTVAIDRVSGRPPRPAPASPEYKCLKGEIKAAIVKHMQTVGPVHWERVYGRPEFEPLCQRGADPLRTFWRWVDAIRSPVPPDRTRPQECRAEAEAHGAWAAGMAASTDTLISEPAWRRFGAKGAELIDLDAYSSEIFKDADLLRRACFDVQGNVIDREGLAASTKQRRAILETAARLKPNLARVAEQDQLMEALVTSLIAEFGEEPKTLRRAVDALQRVWAHNDNTIPVKRGEPAEAANG